MIEQVIHKLAKRALRKQWCGMRLMPNAKEAYAFAKRAASDSTLADNLATREAYEYRLGLEARA